MNIEEIMRSILAECKATDQEAAWLTKLMEATQTAARGAGIGIEDTRCLAIGVHLAAALRRAAAGEALPPIDADTAAQIRPEMRSLAREILQSAEGAGTSLLARPEILLLALHLQCAEEGF